MGSRLCLIAVVLAVGPSHAKPQTQGPQPTEAPQGPAPPAGTQPASSGNAFISKIGNLFTHKPESLLVQNIVPGGGTGGGGHYIKDFNRDPWDRQFRATAVASIRAFWMAELQLRFAHDAFSPWHSAEDKFNMHFFVRTRDLPSMAFYGIGTNPNPSAVAYFHERDTLAGMDVTDPLVSWLAVGGRLEELWPQAGAAGPAAQSITALYPTTPGLATQPSFTHYEIFLRPRYPARPPFNIDYKISYGYFQDHDTGQFSFRRLTVNAYNNIYPFHNSDRSPNADIFFTVRGLIIASDASAGHAVPFFLQPTLGGTDANNDATLRGFSDYQFRAPNAILMQVEYNQRFWKYLGGFVFYDAGKVTPLKSDLNFTSLRQSYGLGVSFWMNDLILFKMYVGLGSGKGPHPYFGIPNFTGETVVTGRGPASTPWN
jgi:hypothetical protein